MEHRRNLTVLDFPLNQIVGKRFRVREEVLFGGSLILLPLSQFCNEKRRMRSIGAQIEIELLHIEERKVTIGDTIKLSN